MAIIPKLTTIAACRVAGIDRDRFNEHVAAGNFPCAPATVPGRARLFDPDDMLALFLFKRFIDDDISPRRAGQMACAIASVARQYPNEAAISYVESYFSGGTATLPSEVPPVEDWDKWEGFFNGTDIRKVTTFRIGKEREIIAHLTATEAAIIGPESDDVGDIVRDARDRYYNGLITRDEFLEIVLNVGQAE